MPRFACQTTIAPQSVRPKPCGQQIVKPAYSCLKIKIQTGPLRPDLLTRNFSAARFLRNFVTANTGIPDAERDRVFRRCHRLDAAPGAEARAGSGLGLSIGQRIAELHRARIELGAGTEGQGIKIRITFAALSSSG